MSKSIKFLQFKCNNRAYSTLVQERLLELGFRWYNFDPITSFSNYQTGYLPYIYVDLIDKTIMGGGGEIDTPFTKSLTIIDLYTKQGIELVT